MKYVVTDIETNGLLDTLTKFWCAWTYDSETNGYTPFTSFSEYVSFLETKAFDGYKLVYHNGCKFDIPAIKKLLGRDLKFDPRICVLDTLVMSRLIYTQIKDIDNGLVKSGRLPKRLYGSYSLKAWGYRLGELKGTYGESEGAWDAYSEDMLKYCKQDVVVTLKLFKLLISKGYPEKAIELEHSIAWVMAKQERNGFVFDYDKAVSLYATLSAKRSEIEDKLVKTFGSWEKYIGDKIYKRDNAKRGIVAGVPYPQYETVVFNPSSREHIAKVLMERGWTPTVFTETGKPKVDEETLQSAMDIPETKLILEYLLIQKRISQLAEGDYAWLKMEKKDGDGIHRIHGSVNPNGTVTGRASHSFPNVAQVPSGHSEYGKECRELFTVPSGWFECGIDACGLELRCLAHFLYPYDKGEYGDIILNGDIHTHNQHLAGLPTRDMAKTFCYGLLYGAGNEKIGSIIGGSASEGKALKDKFMKGLPAYKKLTKAIHNALVEDERFIGGKNIVKWRKRHHRDNPSLDITHCLIGLDGRVLYCRSPHSALNLLLQSAGALVCKQWVIYLEEMMRDRGYKHGWDGDFALMGWIHDECQIACRTKEIAEDCVKIAQEAMRRVQEHFKFNCQLDTEGKIGTNWFECH
jgi:DNA polymerase I-like protein with 3'-5' exonuclease and polymerase domains